MKTSANVVENGVHGYVPEGYVVPAEPEVRERLEWLKDQKLALSMASPCGSQCASDAGSERTQG